LIGGRSKLTLPHLLLQVRGVESTHPDPQFSALFDHDGLSTRVAELKTFLAQLQRKAIERCRDQEQQSACEDSEEPDTQVLRPGSLLHQLLTKEVPDPRTVWNNDVAEIHAQLALLISISAAWLHTHDLAQVREWFEWRNKMLVTIGIEKHDSIVNAHNLVIAALNKKRMQEVGQIWFPMEIMNAVRYLSFSWKVRLREWLVTLLEGHEPEELGRLDAFAFSYMTS